MKYQNSTNPEDFLNHICIRNCYASRDGLATVRGWNRVRGADLLDPTLPHNLGMHSRPGDREQTTTLETVI